MNDREQTTSALPMQLAIAAASPTGWRDGIVLAEAAGRVTIALLDGTLVTVRAHAIPLGEPVAWHRAAELLAAQGTRVPARPIA